jgi:hypothetical protein
MVTGPPFLELAWGGYTLRAVKSGSRSPAAPTRLRLTGVAPDAVAVTVGGVATALGRDGSMTLARTLIQENDSIDVYVDGPMPSVLSTLPSSATIKGVFSQGSFQHFTLQYRGAVGEVEWKWATLQGTLMIHLESFPTKMDYRDDFAAIRRELERIAPMLTASASGQAGAGFDADSSLAQESNIEWITLVTRELDQLTTKMPRLLPALRRRVDRGASVVMSDRLRRARPVSRRAVPGSGRPTPLLVQRFTDSDVTPLNGHLRWEIDQLRAKALSVTTAEWYRVLDSELRVHVDRLLHSAMEWSKPLAHVPPVMNLPSLHTNLRDPLYEGVFRHLRQLRAALVPLQGASLVGLKDLPTLYEYWVFLRVVEILRARFPTVVSFDEPLVQRAGSHQVMVAGRRSRVRLRDDAGREVKCQYNRSFTDLPTTAQRPDAVIWIDDDARMLIIDAKYRIQSDSEYVARFGMPGPKREDINVIHRYRDAIVGSQPPHRQLTRGGLIAFPGRESARYRNHQFFRSWHSVRVGGVPMLPAGTTMMEELIAEYLADDTGGGS